MRQENLTTIKAGISRQRTKGAALKDSLYDLLNGFVTSEKTVKRRPGTSREENLTAGTVGLVHFDGGFHVFASSTVAVPAGYTLHLLISPDDSAFTLSKIHFAEPFLGALYVAAEFSDGNVYHYWLQEASTWAASADYVLNATVQPSIPNGLMYKARRLVAANPAWSANTPRVLTDVVEPTTENNFKYTVTQVVGPTPRSGSIEPIWPTRSGAIIIEDLDDDSTPEVIDAPTPERVPDTFIDEETEERYGDRGEFD